jgi:hypothetical protein
MAALHRNRQIIETEQKNLDSAAENYLASTQLPETSIAWCSDEIRSEAQIAGRALRALLVRSGCFNSGEISTDWAWTGQ